MSKLDFQNGYALGLASGGVVKVEDTTKMDVLDTLIDESGVLSSAEGTITEKIEQLIEKAKSDSSPSIDENGTITFGGSATIDENGIVSL